MTLKLPPLPEPMGYVPFAGEFYQAAELDQEVKDDAETVWCFSMQQMRAYAEEAVRLERDACAKLCDEFGDDYMQQAREGDRSGASDHKACAAVEIAAAIRARSEQAD